jgi:hypothetical protein
MKTIRAFFLLCLALGLAYAAGWGLAGTELSLPAALAAFASLGMAVV